MKCPYCQNMDTSVIDTTKDAHGGIRRRRECKICKQRFSTYERPILATPLIIKRDGTREEFNREKLLSGLRMACSKRPISAAQIDQLVDNIEAELQKKGRSEISSRLVGDLAFKGLKEIDHIAYIRYAIVYLRMDDLHTIRDEINRLLTEEE
ncbi:MAG: transcriptional repressor NrdR [Chloroflexi bacterium]|nr:transcriptional repressor NrdR [Chloroflexota bacterium]